MQFVQFVRTYIYFSSHLCLRHLDLGKTIQFFRKQSYKNVISEPL